MRAGRGCSGREITWVLARGVDKIAWQGQGMFRDRPAQHRNESLRFCWNFSFCFECSGVTAWKPMFKSWAKRLNKSASRAPSSGNGITTTSPSFRHAVTAAISFAAAGATANQLDRDKCCKASNIFPASGPATGCRCRGHYECRLFCRAEDHVIIHEFMYNIFVYRTRPERNLS